MCAFPIAYADRSGLFCSFPLQMASQGDGPPLYDENGSPLYDEDVEACSEEACSEETCSEAEA